ncbi:hypothetical protein Lalb_Chr06g0172851 [Lupinus albus]|uniref:Uncharacterized protein n=1 Tax=Lupinus albus TaxID=3870 RepID=A0A6A4QEP8_LUPAL|nr:hypothetical protein Lalb_Chr06g0172851 [Lupinus albus]
MIGGWSIRSSIFSHLFFTPPLHKVALRPKVPRGIWLVNRHIVRPHIVFIHLTLVDQGRKIRYLLMSKHHLQLGLQAQLKLSTFGPPIHLQLIVRAVFVQFLDLGRIFPQR